MEKLKASGVLVLGLGGVGAYTAEALIRAGIGTLGIADFDNIDISNKNRQLLALDSTVGKPKADIACARFKDINPEAKIILFKERITSENAAKLHIDEYDYIADCIDDVNAKIAVIKLAMNYGTPVISSMGTGNKLDPSRFTICDISRSHTDRLARAVRKRLKAEGIYKGVDVLFSDENPFVSGGEEGFSAIPSISYMPGSAGLMIAGYIIKKILKIT